MKTNRLVGLLSLVVFSVALWLRLVGNNWDAGYHLHPDERFLTMVAAAIRFPADPALFFSSSVSTLNPHNVGFPFYVYGTLPVFVVRLMASFLGWADYSRLNLVGRAISGLLDTGTVVLVWLIARRLFSSRSAVAVLAACYYALLPLAVQNAHYFSVDVFLVFFLALSYLLLVTLTSSSRPDPVRVVGLGLAYGCALASKYSAALFLPVILAGFAVWLYRFRRPLPAAVITLIFFLAAFAGFRLFQPYFFSDLFRPNPEVITNLRTLKSFDDPSGWFPPAVQWISQPKLIFPAVNLFWWGLGPVPFLLAVFSLLLTARRLPRHPQLLPLLLWIIGLFIYAGTGFAMTGRYFYPLLPFLAVITGIGLEFILIRFRRPVLLLVLGLSWLPVVAFITLYSRPHPRVAASAWIRANLPPGSILSCDQWDDCLPLGPGPAYRIVELHPFAPDTKTKWQQFQAGLAEIDYLILSSNRVYGSVTSVPGLYPYMSGFYRRLFSGQTDFQLVAGFTSRPTLPVPGITSCFIPPFQDYGRVAATAASCSGPGLVWVDDYAEEAYTVYDHPAIYIFRNSKSVSTGLPSS